MLCWVFTAAGVGCSEPANAVPANTGAATNKAARVSRDWTVERIRTHGGQKYGGCDHHKIDMLGRICVKYCTPADLEHAGVLMPLALSAISKQNLSVPPQNRLFPKNKPVAISPNRSFCDSEDVLLVDSDLRWKILS